MMTLTFTRIRGMFSQESQIRWLISGLALSIAFLEGQNQRPAEQGPGGEEVSQHLPAIFFWRVRLAGQLPAGPDPAERNERQQEWDEPLFFPAVSIHAPEPGAV